MQEEVISRGLAEYSPADCMHQAGGGCEVGRERGDGDGGRNRFSLVSSSLQGYRFHFLGGTPGWTAWKERATIETVVLVSIDGKNLQVKYNGPVRVQ